MISSIAWVPRGVADPNPKKYEMSAVEAELIQSMQKQAIIGEGDDIQDAVVGESSDQEEDEEDERIKTMALSQVILGGDNDTMLETEDIAVNQKDGDADIEDASVDDEQTDGNKDTGDAPILPVRDSDDGSSDDDDDDLGDIPDTREYTPIDMAALEAMGLARAGMETDQPLMDDDDDSAIEDVRIGPDDALIAVAKTEDVSSGLSLASCSMFSRLSKGFCYIRNPLLR